MDKIKSVFRKILNYDLIIRKLFARYLQQHFPKEFKNGTIRSKKRDEQ